MERQSFSGSHESGQPLTGLSLRAVQIRGFSDDVVISGGAAHLPQLINLRADLVDNFMAMGIKLDHRKFGNSVPDTFLGVPIHASTEKDSGGAKPPGSPASQ